MTLLFLRSERLLSIKLLGISSTNQTENVGIVFCVQNIEIKCREFQQSFCQICPHHVGRDFFKAVIWRPQKNMFIYKTYMRNLVIFHSFGL